MNDLKEFADRAAKIPSMGRATVYDTLNMHAEPNRYSASFYQVTPGMAVEVLTRRVTERTPPPAPEPIIKKPPVDQEAEREEREEGSQIPAAADARAAAGSEQLDGDVQDRSAGRTRRQKR